MSGHWDEYLKEYQRRARIGIPGTTYLVRDPYRCFGAPTIENSRLPVSSIFGAIASDLKRGSSLAVAVAKFADDWGRKSEEIPAIREAYEWARDNPDEFFKGIEGVWYP